jgi:PIN domain nuclease of toxin-antitoxin system
VKVLLDTHAFLWAAMEPRKLSKKVRVHLEDDQGAFLSSASLWELAIKWRTGKLPAIAKPHVALQQALKDLNLIVIPVRASHAMRTLVLPDHHKDPFDRMLVAQAIEEGAAIATADPHIAQYAVDIFW